MSKTEFDEMVQSAIETLPAEFADALDELSIEVMDLPTVRERSSLGDRSQGLLLGLYRGVPRTRRNSSDSGRLPDVIYLFRENIERVCHSREQLQEQVRVTLLHELGHHFGMNEDDLKRHGYG